MRSKSPDDIAYAERLGRSKLKVARDGVRFLYTILRETLVHNPGRLRMLGIAFASPVVILLTITLSLGALRPSPWQAGGAASILMPVFLALSLTALGLSTGGRLAISRLNASGHAAPGDPTDPEEEEG